MRYKILTMVLALLCILSIAAIATGCPGGISPPTETAPPLGAEASSLIPTQNNTFDIGKSSRQWRDFYIYRYIITNDGVGYLTLPTVNTTLIGTDTTSTLTNKTLTTPVIASFYQDAGKTKLMTVPNVASDTLVTLAAAQTLTNKTLTLPIISVISNTGNITLPTSTDTLVGRDTTDTLTNKTLTAPVIASFYQDAGKTKLMTVPNVASDTLVTLAATQTLTNKTLTLPIISVISNTGNITLPTATCTLVGRDTTDTLTNKTLTLPVISVISNTGNITLPTATCTLVGRDTTDTLSNKSFAEYETGSANISAGTGSIIVAHSLGSTPVRIFLTYAGDPGNSDCILYYTSANATYFTISVTTNVTNEVQVDYWLRSADDS